jgi:hypothetical protein
MAGAPVAVALGAAADEVAAVLAPPDAAGVSPSSQPDMASTASVAGMSSASRVERMVSPPLSRAFAAASYQTSERTVIVKSTSDIDQGVAPHGRAPPDAPSSAASSGAL